MFLFANTNISNGNNFQVENAKPGQPVYSKRDERSPIFEEEESLS